MLTEIAIAAALSCAPGAHTTTLRAIIQHESGFNPYAIGVRGKHRLRSQPRSKREAVAIARKLMAKGVTFSAGLGQINVSNWKRLGLKPETVFEPCANVQASQQILAECRAQARSGRTTSDQHTLRATISCYNSGDASKRIRTHYVNKVLALRTDPDA